MKILVRTAGPVIGERSKEFDIPDSEIMSIAYDDIISVGSEAGPFGVVTTKSGIKIRGIVLRDNE